MIAYCFAVGYFHHYKFLICSGITRELAPLVLGEQIYLGKIHPPIAIMAIVMSACLVMNFYITYEKSEAAKRFRSRMTRAAAARGKTYHPALEDLAVV